MTDTPGLPEWVSQLGPEDRAAVIAAMDRARRLAELAAGDPAVEEATLAAWGIRPVTVIYGYPEDWPDPGLPDRLTALAGRCGTVRHSRGDGCSHTWLFEGGDAEAAQLAFMDEVLRIALHWWRVTAAARPVYH